MRACRFFWARERFCRAIVRRRSLTFSFAWMPASWMFARFQASAACETCESIVWIWARTDCASARLPEIVGGWPDADPATKRAARSARSGAGECRRAALTTTLPRSTPGGVPEGAPGRHKHGTLAGVPDEGNRTKCATSGLSRPEKGRTNPVPVLPSRPVGAPTRRVASACFVATIALAGAAAMPGAGGSQTDSLASLERNGADLAARQRSAVLELYGLESRLASAR